MGSSPLSGHPAGSSPMPKILPQRGRSCSSVMARSPEPGFWRTWRSGRWRGGCFPLATSPRSPVVHRLEAPSSLDHNPKMTGNRGSATGRVRGRCSSQTLPCPRPGAQILAHGCVMGDTLTSLLTMASTGVSFGGAKSPACPRRGSVRARRARWQNPIPGPRARCSRASCPSRPDRLRWAQGGSGGSARPARLPSGASGPQMAVSSISPNTSIRSPRAK
jgi:hypothetical protein